MISINRIGNYYRPQNYYPLRVNKTDFNHQCPNNNCADDETYTTWKFDEFGNIVYYTYKVKTGEIVSKVVYKVSDKLLP